MGRSLLEIVLRSSLAVAPFAVAISAWGQTPLTLAEALRLAEARAPVLSASSAAADAAREMAVAAGQLPDPVLRAGVENLPVNGPDAFSIGNDFMTMRRIGVMQEYVSDAKRSARRERGEREARRLEAEREMSRSEVRTDVAIAWYDRFYARRTEQMLQTLADELAMQERASEAQVASGKSSAADALATRAAHVQVSDRMTAVHRQQQAATARLARWLGEDAGRPPIEDAASGDVDVTTLPEHGLHNIPHLRVLAGLADVADADVRVAEQDRSPNWSWEVSYAQRGSAYSNMISVGVSVPLPIARKDRQDRELAARLMQREQARELLQDALRRHRSEFDVLRIELQALTERRRKLEASLIPVTSQRVAALVAAYGSGQQQLSAVLDARRAEIDARIQMLELERDAARVRARLLHAYLEPAGEKP